MIELRCKDGMVFSQLDGTGQEITSDVLCCIKAVYNDLHRVAGEGAAELFRNLVQDAVAMPDLLWRQNEGVTIAPQGVEE